MNGEKELRLNPKSVLTIILGIGMEGGIMQLFILQLCCFVWKATFLSPKIPNQEDISIMRDESHMPFKLLPKSPFKLHTATVHWDWPPGACFTGQKSRFALSVTL